MAVNTNTLTATMREVIGAERKNLGDTAELHHNATQYQRPMTIKIKQEVTRQSSYRDQKE